MSRLIKIAGKIIDITLVLSLATMVIMVFMNVFYRYILDSGLTWSEELARYLFVWVVFLGAVVALKEKAHLGVDILVGAVPKKLQKFFFLIANITIIAVLILCVDGLIQMMRIDSGILAPATNLPINLLPLAGLISTGSMIIISAIHTVQFIFYDKNGPVWAKENKDTVTEKGYHT